MSRSEVRTYTREKRFAQKVANIFLGDKEVKVYEGDLNIAFCSVPDKKIWFDFSEVFKDEDIVKEMMDFKGYAFHEILHLKYTMRITKYDEQRAKNSYFDGLIQRLEDGRIETLGVMRYQKLADYLIHAVNTHILKDREKILKNKDDTIINTFILLYGRAIYFPDKELIADIRKIIVKTYGRDVAERLENDIDKYILETSAKKRFEIAEELYKFLKEKGIFPKFEEGMDSNIFDTTNKERKRLPKEMKELVKQFPKLQKLREKIKKKIQEKSAKLDEKEIEKARQERKSKEEQRKKEIKKKIEELDKEWDKLDDEWHDKKDTDLKKDIQKKMDKNTTEIDELENELKNLEKKDKNSPLLSEKDREKLAELISRKAQENSELEANNMDDLEADLKDVGHLVKAVYSDDSFQIDRSMVRSSKKISRGLKKLNTDLKQGYVNRQKSGRLNARQLINRKNPMDTKVFKKWLPSEVRKTKMLINIFIDGSGSMAGKSWEKTLGALWVINEAFNKDDNKIMAYQFSTRYSKIKGYDEKLTRPAFMGNNTYVLQALRDAFPQIEAYKKANNYNNVIDIIISDGYFQDNSDEIKKINEKMVKKGHHVIMLNVTPNTNETYKAYFGGFGFQHMIFLENFDELTPKLIKIFGQIKKSLIKKAVIR